MYLNTFKHIQTHVLRVNYNFDLASLTIWVQTRISNYFDTVENDYCWNFSGLTTIFTNTAILIKTNNQMNWSGFFTTSYEWRKKQVFFLKKKIPKLIQICGFSIFNAQIVVDQNIISNYLNKVLANKSELLTQTQINFHVQPPRHR